MKVYNFPQFGSGDAPLIMRPYACTMIRISQEIQLNMQYTLSGEYCRRGNYLWETITSKNQFDYKSKMGYINRLKKYRLVVL